MTQTANRRAAIRNLIEAGGVHNQYDLYVRLKKKGIHASQPAISRDLRALGVAKQAGVYTIAQEERVTPLGSMKSLLRAAVLVPRFVLVSCEPGAASAVARALEAEAIDGMIGTVAGDDTVLVAVASSAAGERVRRFVSGILETNP